jgi:hypothetical protein
VYKTVRTIILHKMVKIIVEIENPHLPSSKLRNLLSRSVADELNSFRQPVCRRVKGPSHKSGAHATPKQKSSKLRKRGKGKSSKNKHTSTTRIDEIDEHEARSAQIQSGQRSARQVRSQIQQNLNQQRGWNSTRRNPRPNCGFSILGSWGSVSWVDARRRWRGRSCFLPPVVRAAPAPAPAPRLRLRLRLPQQKQARSRWPRGPGPSPSVDLTAGRDHGVGGAGSGGGAAGDAWESGGVGR